MESGIFDDILNDKIDITPKYFSCNNILDDILIEQIRSDAKMEARLEFCSIYMKNEAYYQSHIQSLTEQLLVERNKNKSLSNSCLLFSSLLKEYKEKYDILIKKCIKKKIFSKTFLENLIK